MNGAVAEDNAHLWSTDKPDRLSSMRMLIDDLIEDLQTTEGPWMTPRFTGDLVPLRHGRRSVRPFTGPIED